MERIQSPQLTEARKKSDTESARCIGSFFEWSFDDDDRVVATADAPIAYTIEDLAEAAVSLGWIVNHRVNWSAMPHPWQSDSAATKIREVLNRDGTFPGRGVTGLS